MEKFAFLAYSDQNDSAEIIPLISLQFLFVTPLVGGVFKWNSIYGYWYKTTKRKEIKGYSKVQKKGQRHRQA